MSQKTKTTVKCLLTRSVTAINFRTVIHRALRQPDDEAGIKSSYPPMERLMADNNAILYPGVPENRNFVLPEYEENFVVGAFSIKPGFNIYAANTSCTQYSPESCRVNHGTDPQR
jgi:hypothetical protein